MNSIKKKSSHPISVEKTQVNCQLKLNHQDYYLSDTETDKCHQAFADIINEILAKDTHLPFFSIVNRQLYIDLLIDFDTNKEFKHSIHLSKDDIGQKFQQAIFNTLSGTLKNKIEQIKVRILYSPELQDGELAVKLGNNAYHGKEDDINIKVTRVFEDSKDSKPLIVGYKQQTCIALDSFLLKNDIIDADDNLQNGYIGIYAKEDTDINGPYAVPEVSEPKGWQYQWDNKQLTLSFIDKASQEEQTLCFLVEFDPTMQEKAVEIKEDINTEAKKQQESSTPENAGPESSNTPAKAATAKSDNLTDDELTPEVTFDIAPEPEPTPETEPKKLKILRENEELSAEATFEPLTPKLKLVLTSVITKGAYLNTYGITQVATDRLNGREQTPTNPVYADLGINTIWQVNDKVSIEIQDQQNIIFGRNTAALAPLLKYQAINTAGENYPLARYGLSREHYNLSMHSEKELQLSPVSEKKSFPAFVLNKTEQKKITSTTILKEGDSLLIGLFIFKLVHEL